MCTVDHMCSTMICRSSFQVESKHLSSSSKKQIPILSFNNVYDFIYHAPLAPYSDLLLNSFPPIFSKTNFVPQIIHSFLNDIVCNQVFLISVAHKYKPSKADNVKYILT